MNKSMKKPVVLLIYGVLLGLPALAQRDVPPPPGVKIKPRSIDRSGQGGVELVPKNDGGQVVRYTTHIILSESRIWTSAEGKPLEAKLLAFEDLVVETTQGKDTPDLPEPPKHPTVVRNDKVRLLVGKKPVELPLARLSQADRDFIERIRRANEPAEPSR